VPFNLYQSSRSLLPDGTHKKYDSSLIFGVGADYISAVGDTLEMFKINQ